MSLNLTTALIIQHNEVETFALGPFPNGKYGSIVYFIKNDIRIKPIISIQNGEFYTCKEAIDKLDSIVNIVRDLDLPIQKEELESISF